MLSVCPNPSQSLARWKKIGSYLNASQTKVNVVAAIDGSRLLSIDDLFGSNAKPGTARDENIDIYRLEKYFNPLMPGGNNKVTHT